MDPVSLLEFAKVAGPAALGAIIVMFLLLKFLPDYMAASKEALKTVVDDHKANRAEDRAAMREGFDRVTAAIKENGEQDRGHRTHEGDLTRAATADLTKEVREAMRASRRSTSPG